MAPADIRKQWQEARANRRMQFKVGNYRDGSWESNIRMLTGTIKVGYSCQLSCTLLPSYIETRCHCWGIQAERCCPLGNYQGRDFLPNNLSLEDRHAGVYGLPTVWPEASMLGAPDENHGQKHVGGS